MPKQITMTFRRDDSSGPGCLEYSYVPEGKRHLIRLGPGQKEGKSIDSIPEGLKPSHVQVYRLDNNLKVSTEMWQFPPGPPHATPIAEAGVVVEQLRRLALGYVKYEDGSTASDSHPLDPISRPCPQTHSEGEKAS